MTHANAKPVLHLEGQRHLTAAQLEVTKRIAIGLERSEIALAMGIGIRTVDSHRIEALRRLGLRNNVELAHWAIQGGVVPL